MTETSEVTAAADWSTFLTFRSPELDAVHSNARSPQAWRRETRLVVQHRSSHLRFGQVPPPGRLRAWNGIKFAVLGPLESSPAGRAHWLGARDRHERPRIVPERLCYGT